MALDMESVRAQVFGIARLRVAEPIGPIEHCQTCGRALRAGSKVCPNCIKKRETFWRLFSYVKPYKGIAILGFTLTLAVTAIGLLPPQLNIILIDQVITPVIVEYMIEDDDGVGVRRQLG